MKTTFAAFLLALALAGTVLAPDAHAQRPQALCKDLLAALNAGTETGEFEIDDAACINFEGRIYSGTPGEGLEEDAIIGVGSVDVTLTNDQIDALATTRVEIVPAQGPGTYVFLDWVAVVKTDADTVPNTLASATMGVTVAPQAGGVLTGAVPTVYWTATGFGVGVFDAGASIRRLRPGAFGIGEVSLEDTPVVAVVSTDEAGWTAMAAEIADTVTLRIVARYRVITTADQF